MGVVIGECIAGEDSGSERLVGPNRYTHDPRIVEFCGAIRVVLEEFGIDLGRFGG